MGNAKKRLLTAALAVSAFVLGAATVVVAANGPTVVRGVGSDINRVRTATSNDHFSITDGTADLPGARHRLILSKSPGTLVVSRFTAPTMCTGDPGRLHAQVAVLDNRNADALVAMTQPVGHIDSTFGNDGHESHAVESSITLPPGDYDFQMRLFTAGISGGTVTCSVPSWHFTVERIA
jgi:hypothetical protein